MADRRIFGRDSAIFRRPLLDLVLVSEGGKIYDEAMSLLPRINTLWRLPLLVAWTMFMATVSVAGSLFDSTGRIQHRCANIWSRVVLYISRVKVEVQGIERVRPSGPCIFVSNHLSMFDIWAFLACLPFQFRFVAKISLFRWPFLGWHLRRSGNIPIDRRNPRKAIESYSLAGARIRTGVSVVVFPEGSRSRGESVQPFKRGSFLLAQQAQVPIVPVTIVGSHRLLPRGSVVIRPGKMRIILHDPIPPERFREMDLQDLADSVRMTVLAHYQQEPS